MKSIFSLLLMAILCCINAPSAKGLSDDELKSAIDNYYSKLRPAMSGGSLPSTIEFTVEKFKIINSFPQKIEGETWECFHFVARIVYFNGDRIGNEGQFAAVKQGKLWYTRPLQRPVFLEEAKLNQVLPPTPQELALWKKQIQDRDERIKKETEEELKRQKKQEEAFMDEKRTEMERQKKADEEEQKFKRLEQIFKSVTRTNRFGKRDYATIGIEIEQDNDGRIVPMVVLNGNASLLSQCNQFIFNLKDKDRWAAAFKKCLQWSEVAKKERLNAEKELDKFGEEGNETTLVFESKSSKGQRIQMITKQMTKTGLHKVANEIEWISQFVPLMALIPEMQDEIIKRGEGKEPEKSGEQKKADELLK